MKIAGWMPLKKDSTRLPGKNWRNLGGIPLWQHMAKTMLAVCDEVWINSEKELRTWDARLAFIDRKPEHREPTLSPVEMLIDDLDTMDADIVVNCHATIPLLKPETLRAAIDLFVDMYPKYDSCISVTRLQERFYNVGGKPINFSPHTVIPLQDIEPTYLENSAFFILMSDDWRRLRRRVGNHPYMYEVDKVEAVEIDDEDDWQYAEWLYQRQQKERDIEAEAEAHNAGIVNKFDLTISAGRML